MIKGLGKSLPGMTGTAGRDKATEEAGGQIMKDLVHLFAVPLCEMGSHQSRVLSREETQFA